MPRGEWSLSAQSAGTAPGERGLKNQALCSDSNSLGCECARGGPTASQHLLISGHRGSDTAQVGGSDSAAQLPARTPTRLGRSTPRAGSRSSYLALCRVSRGEARVHTSLSGQRGSGNNPLSGFSQGQVHSCVTRHNTPSPQSQGRLLRCTTPSQRCATVHAGPTSPGASVPPDWCTSRRAPGPQRGALLCQRLGARAPVCALLQVCPPSGGLSAASGVAGAGGALPL